MSETAASVYRPQQMPVGWVRAVFGGQ